MYPIYSCKAEYYYALRRRKPSDRSPPQRPVVQYHLKSIHELIQYLIFVSLSSPPCTFTNVKYQITVDSMPFFRFYYPPYAIRSDASTVVEQLTRSPHIVYIVLPYHLAVCI